MNKQLSYIILFIFIISEFPASAQKDLTLSLALEKALQNNYGIILSTADTEIAAINNSWGTAGRIPTVGFDASSSNSYDLLDNTASNRLSLALGMDWILFDGFRVDITKDKLEDLETLSGGRLAVVVENTIEDVILYYQNVLLQQERLKVLEKVMTLSEDRYNYEMKRYELGGSVTYNVLQAKTLYLSDKASFMNQEVVVRNAIRNLNFVLGEDPVVSWKFTEPFDPAAEEYVLSDLLAKMLSNNQTLQNQYVNLMLQQKEVAIQKSDYYPTVRLGAGIENSYSRMQQDGGDPTTTSGLSPYGNLSLSFDIYDAGNRASDIQIARINEEMAQVEIEQMEHSLTNLLLNVYDYYTVRIALLEVAVESLEAAELNLQIADEKFKTGAINSFNYRDIQLIYLNAALGRLQAVYNLIDSKTVLTRLTGGFISDE
ncbi:MAG: TolC family protein [Bacteroidales bacterium]|nr:TolC family protein [Bacteroidales bacterium]